jgi:hypothetical protein
MLHRFVIDWRTAYTTSGTEIAIPTDSWERVRPSSTAFARGWVEVRGKQGTVSMGVGFQVSNDLVAIDASTRCSALATADGVTNPSGTPTSVDLDAAKYIRPCIFLKTGDASLAGGAISGIVEIWE